MVAQRVYGLSGYEDLNDHDQLRHDPMFAIALGKLSASEALVPDGRKEYSQSDRTLETVTNRQRADITELDMSRRPDGCSLNCS